jgi:hypothetical protein
MHNSDEIQSFQSVTEERKVLPIVTQPFTHLTERCFSFAISPVLHAAKYLYVKYVTSGLECLGRKGGQPLKPLRTMERFVRNLSTFATTCRQDLTGFHVQEERLNAGYKKLKRSVKESLMGSSKPPRVDPAHSAVRTQPRMRRNEQRTILPPLQKRANSDLQPSPFPVRSYALPAQPCQAAARMYRPKARALIEDERLELIDEYVSHPSEEGALLLDGRIDPILRVGDFSVHEMRWKGRVPTAVV